MTPNEWDLLLDRYLAGECAPAEEALVEQELTARGGSLATVAALRAAHAAAAGGEAVSLSGRVPPAEVAAALARLDQRLVDAGLRPAATPRLRLRLEPVADRSGRGWLAPSYGLRAAGVAALLLSGGGAAWLMTRPFERSTAVLSAAGREFVTARGQRATFRLIDGTEVMLGVDSRLRLSATYGAARRDVYLDGEAYFTVVHDATRPFAVHTPRGVTRDVGTKFDVRAYRDDTAEWIVVAEGAVAVAATTKASNERLLKAGQLAVVSPTGAIATAEKVDVDAELAWTRGELRLQNTPLGAAIRRLEQWYDIDIDLADSVLADRPVSGVYAGEPVDQVLTLITAAIGARFERHGKRVVISTETGGPQS